MVVLTTIFILVTGIISVLILDQTYQHLMHEWDNDLEELREMVKKSHPDVRVEIIKDKPLEL